MSEGKDLVTRRKQLQALVGKFPIVLIETFQNWGRTQTVQVLSVKPKNVKEVAKVVKAANSAAKADTTGKTPFTIRCVGDGHSWSPLYPDEGNILMYIADLMPANGQRIKLNEPENADDDITVTIAPGVTTGELSDFFTKNNVCLKSNVILDKVMYGGVIATGCHGVGKDQMSVSDSVVGMSLVHANGDIKTYDFYVGSDDDQLYYNCLKCNLGLFGVMTDITLKVEPMVTVKVENDFSLTVQDVFYAPEKLKKLHDENWSLEIFWFPFNSMQNWEAMMLGVQSWCRYKPRTQFISVPPQELRCRPRWWDPRADKLWIRKINIVDVPEETCRTPTDYLFAAANDLASTTFGRHLSKFLNDYPGCVPSFLKVGFEMVQRFNKETTYETINKAIHYQNFLEVFPVVDMEFAFNAPTKTNEAFTVQAQAMQKVVEAVKAQRYCLKPQFPLSVAMEMRWMASSDALLCPARVVSNPAVGGSGNTLYLEVLGIAGQHDNIWEKFTKHVATKWKELAPGGKKPVPHWAKQWSYLGGIDSYVQKVYGDAFEKFKTACSPGSEIFTNETLRSLLKPKTSVEKDEPEPEPEPEPTPEVSVSDTSDFGEAHEKSWLEFWRAVGDKAWSIPNAVPRPYIESEWKMARGLMDELHVKIGEHEFVNEPLIRSLFKDED